MSINNDKPLENFIAELRSQGLSKMDSIKKVSSHFQLSFEDAKKAVHESLTWNDVRERDELLNDQLMDALEAFSKQDS